MNTLPDIHKTITLDAPISQVWEAVATSEGIAAWFMSNDLMPEEGYEFHLNAGPFGMSPCQVIKVEPEQCLSFKWGKDWTITFTLEAHEKGTIFTLVHTGWDADQVTEFQQPHVKVRENMDHGWNGIMQALVTYVEA